MLYQDYKGRGEVEFADNQLTNFAFDTCKCLQCGYSNLFSIAGNRGCS